MISRPSLCGMQIFMKTTAAQYIASKPASSYKKMYAHLTEQADIAVEVRQQGLAISRHQHVRLIPICSHIVVGTRR